MRQIKKVAVTTISIALAFSLSSCYGAGPDAATRMIKRVTDGNEGEVTTNGSNLRVDNVLVVATEDGSAVVVGQLVNRAAESDQLLGVSIDGVRATLTGETKLLTNKPVRFEGEQANAKAFIPAFGATAGTHVTVSFGFARAGLVSIQAIVRDKRDVYADVTTGAKLATPAATPAK
jgi:hypothetical protein